MPRHPSAHLPPALLALAAAVATLLPLPATAAEDGPGIRPLATGKEDSLRDRPMAVHHDHQPAVAIRNGRWKLVGTQEEQPEPLPRVLLIGDSICGGYHKIVRQQLEGIAEVSKNEGNAEYTGTGLKRIDEWLGDGNWDVIHFNWGLWDMYGWRYREQDRSPAIYGKRLEALVTRLGKTGAKLIWATTTPACPGPEGTMLKRWKTELTITPEVEREYLDAARRVMNKHDVTVNDLHALMLPDLARFSPAPDNVHFTGAGYGKLGRQVADAILQQLGATGTAAPGAGTRRPNVLFLFTDDQRHDTIGALGNDAIRTPHIDRLAGDGVSFTNAYIMGGTSPAVCSPSRACLFSGRTLWNIECQGMWGFEISDKFRTLPQVFRENGYATFGTGKNEPGRAGHFARSFSGGDKILFRGMTRSQYELPLFAFSATGDYTKAKAVLHSGKHSAEVYADACIGFLGSRADDDPPFFAYVAFQTPHDPRQCPQEYRSRYVDDDIPLPPSFQPQHPFDNGMLKIRDEKLAPFPRTEAAVRKHIADYFATITHTDAQIGRILKALEKTGEMADTIVVFSSDNGLAVGRHGLMGKQNVYDHSVHVPMIVAGPGIPKGEVRDQLCYIYDIYPTLCEQAGIETPDTVQFKSLNRAIDDPAAKHREHLYFAFMSWQRAVRDARFKLIEYCVEGSRHTQLFDLAGDPHETRNLAGDPGHEGTLDRLRTVLREERLNLNDGNTPFPFADKLGKDFWKLYESTR